ncbi:hypothetical protein [Agrobacterium sp. fls2-241-TYG-188a]|uniref:hypothetical protein n=1 Tax=Agrobacterium sp. fls2-241-TYG-188a TaxID=3040275 RepID=UPI002550DA8B|nr:hypothetical protein [Agrobacterium sp. fls2-241-TYG-188a]
MDWQTITLSWGFNYATLVGFLVTAGLALWTFVSLPRSRLAYNIQHSTIIGRSQTAFSGDLEVTYKRAPITRATLTRLYVWNDGNQTIRRSDITRKDPLGIFVPGGQFLLQLQVSQLANEAMDVTFGDGDEASDNITFEYIEPRQGFVCEILHTASSSDFAFSGTLIGAGEPVRKELPGPRTSMPLALSVVALGVIMLFVLVKVHQMSVQTDDRLFSYVFGTALITAVGGSCIFTCYKTVKGAFPRANFGSKQTDITA